MPNRLITNPLADSSGIDRAVELRQQLVSFCRDHKAEPSDILMHALELAFATQSTEEVMLQVRTLLHRHAYRFDNLPVR